MSTSEFIPFDNYSTKISSTRNVPLWINQLLNTIKWKSCIYGIIFGSVVTSCIAACIVLVIDPYITPEEDYPSTLGQHGQAEFTCDKTILWEKCSVTCGNGHQTGLMNVTCQRGHNDTNVWKEHLRRDCMPQYCPVDGKWSDWKKISACSVTCGVGVIRLLRQCSNPQPQYGGRVCDGNQLGLGFCKLTPCNTFTNIALGKHSTQSSTKCCPAERWVSELALDGLILTRKLTIGQAKCTHTNKENMPWWAVDLGDIYNIQNVLVYGRTDCCGDRLKNFSIEAIMPDLFEEHSWSIFEDAKVQLCHYQESELPNHILNATCKQETIGKYVRIKLHGFNCLTLCEVEIYGSMMWPFLSVQKFKDSNLKLSQSESYDGQLVESVSMNNKSHCTEWCKTNKTCETAYYGNGKDGCIILTKGNNSDNKP